MSSFELLGQSKKKGTIALESKQVVVGIYFLNQSEEVSISMRQCDALLGWDGYGPEGKTSKSQVLINQVKDKHRKNKSIESHTGGKTVEELMEQARQFLANAAAENDENVA